MSRCWCCMWMQCVQRLVLGERYAPSTSRWMASVMVRFNHAVLWWGSILCPFRRTRHGFYGSRRAACIHHAKVSLIRLLHTVARPQFTSGRGKASCMYPHGTAHARTRRRCGQRGVSETRPRLATTWPGLVQRPHPRALQSTGCPNDGTVVLHTQLTYIPT